MALHPDSPKVEKAMRALEAAFGNELRTVEIRFAVDECITARIERFDIPEDVLEEIADLVELGAITADNASVWRGVTCFMQDVAREVVRARRLFPGNRLLLDALHEEVGELQREMLNQANGSRGAVADEDIYREAVQTAAMAVRLATEGSREYPYRPPARLPDGSS